MEEEEESNSKVIIDENYFASSTEVEEEVKEINDVVRNIINSEPQQDIRKYIMISYNEFLTNRLDNRNWWDITRKKKAKKLVL